MSTNIHQVVMMPTNTFFTYTVGSTCTLVVRDGANTKTHKSSGFPSELISLLELRGFRRHNFGK